MRVRALIVASMIAGCANAPPAEPVALPTPPPPPETRVVVVEKPVIVEKRVIVEKPVPGPPVVIERPLPPQTPPPVPTVPPPPAAKPHARPIAKAPGRSPCAGLLEAACKAPTCRWVKHARPKDKHGRPLRDYCRLRGKA